MSFQYHAASPHKSMKATSQRREIKFHWEISVYIIRMNHIAGILMHLDITMYYDFKLG